MNIIDIVTHDSFSDLMSALISFNSITFGLSLTSLSFFGSMRDKSFFNKYLLEYGEKHKIIFMIALLSNLVSIVLAAVLIVLRLNWIFIFLMLSEISVFIFTIVHILFLLNFSFMSDQSPKVPKDPSSK